MGFALAHCVWMAVVLTALAPAQINPQRVIANQLASSSPSGVNVFLARAAETPDEGSNQSRGDTTIQLCWGGERGMIARTFRLTALSAKDAAGNAVTIAPRLADANHAAWREVAHEARIIGDAPALALPLFIDPAPSIAKIAKISGTLELKLGKNIVRVPPQARAMNQVAQSSVLEAKGFKLREIGMEQRFNVQFVYSNDKKGAPPTLFFLNADGKPLYSSKPRQSDGLAVMKILPSDPIPPNAKFRVGVDRGNTIDGAAALLRSKESLTAALAKRGLKVVEYSSDTSDMFTLEITRATATAVVPEVVLDFKGIHIKGKSVVLANQQDPNAPTTFSWSFEIPSDLVSKRPDVLVLLPDDEGHRSIPFEFAGPFVE